MENTPLTHVYIPRIRIWIHLHVHMDMPPYIRSHTRVYTHIYALTQIHGCIHINTEPHVYMAAFVATLIRLHPHIRTHIHA
ncbi:hypothetical protein LOAG_11361 [Loa loa]|uniref:Uncharacterized protein n=1 Tax=Loa loa TaxID=7209 RepID=A0A1S0TN85_LOALO|nr:hypothetical protein LOAG_11361 [Loa loa]EFO17140.1 hypothetical protein LOAG_11361 [Loa loa]